MQLPPYSVLISVYKKEKAEYLASSLSSMIMQTHMPNEIVLVCDGELTSEIEATITKFRNQYPRLLKIVRIEKSVDLGGVLNKGLQYCKNEYIARMDSDDISLPNRVERQLTYMVENSLALCGCSVVEFSDGKTFEHLKSVPQLHKDIIQYARKRNPFNHPSVIFTKSAVLAVDGYQQMPFFEDYFLWIRMLKIGARSGNLSETLLRMRGNAAFYIRRGGIAYCRHLINFWLKVAQIGFITRPEAVRNVFIRLIVAIIPNWLRKRVYHYFLRA